MKKNLQEAEYKEIKGLDIRGQLLENAGTPEDRGDGKPFLMHKLRVMIGPYQKDIPITNQELRKIMFIQENKEMTLKEMIKEELEKAIGEINMPFKVAMEIKNLDDNISRLMAQRDSIAREHGEKPRYAKMVRDMGGLTREGEGAPVSVPVGSRHKAKRLYRLGYEDGLRGQLPRNLKLRDNEHYKAGNEEGEKERDAGRGYD